MLFDLYCILRKIFVKHILEMVKSKNNLTARAVNLAPRVPVQRQVLNQINLINPKSLRNLKSLMHLHKMIIIRANERITALKQNTDTKAILVVNGTRILIFMASEGPIGRGKSPIGSRHNVKATAIVARKLRKKGKYSLLI